MKVRNEKKGRKRAGCRKKTVIWMSAILAIACGCIPVSGEEEILTEEAAVIEEMPVPEDQEISLSDFDEPDIGTELLVQQPQQVPELREEETEEPPLIEEETTAEEITGNELPEAGELLADDGTPLPEAEEVPLPEGLVRRNGNTYFLEDGKRVRSSWITADHSDYYFKKNGAAAQGACEVDGTWYVFDKYGRLSDGLDCRIVTVGKKRFFADEEGHPLSGWRVYNQKLYYAMGEEGGFRIVTDDHYDKIYFDRKGEAQDSLNKSLKLRTMEIVGSITQPSMSPSEKLRACWNYVVSSRFSYFGNYPDMGDSNWPRKLAYDFFTQGGGNCYGFACSFSALAHELGYPAVVVYGLCPGSRDGRADGLTRHCLMSIDGAYYDPEGQYAGWAGGIYGSGYSSLVSVTGTLRF